ncbi:unnamed protein product [marine sediment metagenome]|uniref:Uncharacterized protein n=1 Tax=marine sediment metagenome TaxID=412755 RepID=X0YES8_9ZZZZ
MGKKFTIEVDAAADCLDDELLVDCELAVAKVLDEWGFTATVEAKKE